MNPINFEDARAVVLGAGVSGRAMALFLLDLGVRVDMLDDLPFESLPDEAKKLKSFGAVFLQGIEAMDPLTYDMALASPGVPLTAPAVKLLRKAGVPLMGEIELGARFLSAPMVAVTGTNGKSTVTELVGEILRSSGKEVFVGGNLGRPLIEAAGKRWDAAVVEVSSYQLETTSDFKPRASILLNITDDHLERHGDINGYAAAKAKIFVNQDKGDLAVVNADDPLSIKASETAHCKKLFFSTDKKLSEGAWIEAGEAVFRLPDSPESRFPLKELKLPGVHNVSNVLAACLACSWVGVGIIEAWEVSCRFKGLAHRLENFLAWRNINFVDDSKATNVDAAIKALEAVSGPIVWIGGGVDKGGAYEPLALKLKKCARLAILAGPAAPLIAKSLNGNLEYYIAPNWNAAFSKAISEARAKDTILLAPACSSFDSFTGYSERGNTFQKVCMHETKRMDNGD